MKKYGWTFQKPMQENGDDEEAHVSVCVGVSEGAHAALTTGLWTRKGVRAPIPQISKGQESTNNSMA